MRTTLKQLTSYSDQIQNMINSYSLPQTKLSDLIREELKNSFLALDIAITQICDNQPNHDMYPDFVDKDTLYNEEYVKLFMKSRQKFNKFDTEKLSK